MKCRNKNRVVSAFTLGYFLSLLNERSSDNSTLNEKTKEQIFFLYKEEIISTIQSLYFNSFKELLVFDEYPKSAVTFFETINHIFKAIKEKDHWGDDSFLETAFLSGSFLCVIESCDDEQINLCLFEQILMEIMHALQVNIDYREFSRTITKIRSSLITERKCSRDEIFLMISGTNQDHKSIIDIQTLIDNPSTVSETAFA